MTGTLFWKSTLGVLLGALALMFATGTPSPPNETLKTLLKAATEQGCQGCAGCNVEEGEGEGEGEQEGEIVNEGEGEGEGMKEGENEGEGEIPVEGEGEGESEGEQEGEPPMEGEPVIVPPEVLDLSAGTFRMGRPYTYEGDDNERPVHEVYLDAYQIGKFEVTNQEYADVLNWAHRQGYLTDSGGGAYTGGTVYAYSQPIVEMQSSDDYSQITYNGGVFGVRSRWGYGSEDFSMADHPVIMVSWYGAVCYCNWLSEQQELQPCYSTADWTRYEPVRNGYRLPTEAEWERAAAWDAAEGGEHWHYGMTSNNIDITRANYYPGEATWANPLDLIDWPFTSPVGWYNGVNPARLSTPANLTKNATSPAGAYDMAGNAHEWCHDWYRREYTVDPVTNPTGPNTGSDRLLRGGSASMREDECRAAYRDSNTPEKLLKSYGFRISRTP